MKKTNKTYNGKNVISVKMNNYVKPNPTALLIQAQKWITNDVDNSYFQYIENRYLGSPTNQSIIDAFANYIYGEGMQFSNSDLDLSKILSKTDARLISKDIKMFGAFTVQVVYTADRKDIAKIYHLPVKSVAIAKQLDITDEPQAYWYCFDWALKTKFKPQLIPAFGYGEDSDTEIAYFRIPSPQPLYSLPDYQSGMQYCQLEEELSNFFIKHIQNNFSAGKIININQGIPDTDEAQEEAERAILSKVQGSSNAGNIIISFNDNKDNATTVDNIEITDAHQQYEWLSEQARTMIMLSHKVNDPSLFGLPMASGFSSVADQMVQSLKILYRNQIKPMREIVIDGLESIFAYNGKGLQIEYIDFEELRVQAPAATPATKMKMAAAKVGFDYDGTASTAKGQEWVDGNIAEGNTVYLISARSDDATLLEYAHAHGILPSRVYAVGSNEEKVAKVLELGLDIFYDNNPDVISQLPTVGIQFNN